MRVALWILVAIAALLAVDRLLLFLEARGWIFYRRTKGKRGGAMFHTLEMQSVFDPGARHAQEIIVEEQEEQDESGDPPSGDPPTRDLPPRP